MIPVSCLAGLLVGTIISVVMSVQRVDDVLVDYTVKTQQRGSVKLSEGFDRRVQYTVPAWALELQEFDNIEL